MTNTRFFLGLDGERSSCVADVVSLSLPLFRDLRILLRGISLSEESGCDVSTVSAFHFHLIGIGCMCSGAPVLLFWESVRD